MKQLQARIQKLVNQYGADKLYWDYDIVEEDNEYRIIFMGDTMPLRADLVEEIENSLKEFEQDTKKITKKRGESKMKHTYNMIGYAKQLQNDLKEFNGVDVTLDEIIKEHDLKPNKLYVTDNELVLLEVLENENWQRKLDLIDDKLFDLAMRYDELFMLDLEYDDHTALLIDLRYGIIETLKEHGVRKGAEENE